MADNRETNETELARWVADRAAKDEVLYERYGKQFEPEHNGEFVAISDVGDVLLGANELQLSMQAAAAFGPGKYALRKIGAVAEGRWRGWRLR